MSEIKKSDMHKVLTGLIDVLSEEDYDLFKSIIDHVDIDINDINDPETFDIALNYHWTKFIEGLMIHKGIKCDKVIFIYKNYGFVSRHFNRFIVKIDGLACSVDKERTIMRRLVEYYLTGKKIEFDKNAKYTYHHPVNVFNNHDDIIEYFEALYNLYYCHDHDKYLKVLGKLFKPI